MESITTDGKDYDIHAAKLISKTFTEDPLLRFFLSSLSDQAWLAYLETYVRCLTKAAMLNGVIFQEANDWSCCAIWVPPGKQATSMIGLIRAGFLGCVCRVRVGGCKRMIDFGRQADACRRRHLLDGQGNPVKTYVHLFFIATDIHARGRGLASSIIAEYQEKMKKNGDGRPIWLEASTERARNVYLRRGFRVAEVMHFGVGTHAADGTFKEGGEGVQSTAMYWSPSWEQKAIQ